MRGIWKNIAMAHLMLMSSGMNMSISNDTSRESNTRLPTDHEENIKKAQLKRYRKACKNGYIGTIEEFLGGLES